MNTYFCNKTPFPITSCKLHKHDKWELIYQLSGENHSKIGEHTYPISPGCVMIIPPDVVHDGKSDGYYTDMYIQAANIDFCSADVVYDYDGDILLLFNMLHKSFLKKDNNYCNICDSLLETICQLMKKYKTENYKHTFIYDLKNYIYENISNSDFKIADISTFLGYNIDYIRRSFLKETGILPHEYLTELRISLAKKLLLQETFQSVENVAVKCGYSDSFYFAKIFRKKTGLTPSMYRKENKNR